MAAGSTVQVAQDLGPEICRNVGESLDLQPWGQPLVQSRMCGMPSSSSWVSAVVLHIMVDRGAESTVAMIHHLPILRYVRASSEEGRVEV